ncbi:MAG TPA: glycerophosphodiester phosphodiesterase family protein, partial [Candidatus Limnocylindria bacterium]
MRRSSTVRYAPRWRLAAIAAACLALLTSPALAGGPAVGERLPAPGPHRFDLEAHRGGLGLVTESTLEGFANALEVGVTTIELDVQITEDERAVVTHDRQVSDLKCDDTAPAFEGDPEFPY